MARKNVSELLSLSFRKDFYCYHANISPQSVSFCANQTILVNELVNEVHLVNELGCHLRTQSAEDFQHSCRGWWRGLTRTKDTWTSEEDMRSSCWMFGAEHIVFSRLFCLFTVHPLVLSHLQLTDLWPHPVSFRVTQSVSSPTVPLIVSADFSLFSWKVKLQKGWKTTHC